MLTVLLLALPLLFIVPTFILKGKQSAVAAFIGSIATLVISFVMYAWFVPDATTQFEFDTAWVENFGIRFHVGIDGISLVMVMLTTLISAFIILATFKREYSGASVFYSLILLMEAGMLGVFVAKDAFLFYVCYELALIPIYFICGYWGGENRVRITLKFFIYTMAGSLFMMLAIIYLYFKTPGVHTFDITSFYTLDLSATEQAWLFWAFFVAFAVKIPIFPFHTWQPETYTVAPTAGTMLLAGIMLKMGIYGLIRFVVPVLPAGIEQWGALAMFLCIIGIVYGGIIVIKQKDLKTFAAYSSIAHVGLIAAGIFALNVQGLQGALLQSFNHGVNVVTIFFLIDIIERQTGTRMISKLGGIANRSRVLAVTFMILLLGNIGLPLTNGFVGEFLLLFGIYNWNMWAAVIAGTTIIIGAVYMFRMYREVFLGELSEASESVSSSLSIVEKSVLYPLCFIILLFGLFPNLLLDISGSSVQQILEFFANHKTMFSGV